ncbi:hypothetical protein LCGC14_2046950, partial [marine sediment metagenome]
PEAFRTYRPEDIVPPPNVPRPLAAFAREELAEYYGNISALDAEMGRLLDALDRLDLARDTIVVFTSDHGDHLWSHGYGKPGDRWLHPSKRASKATPYEESIHVPFILRWPARVDAAARSDVLLGTVDIMPTLLGLCGVEAPGDLAGTDLSHAAAGGEGPEPDSVYLQNMGEGWPYRGEWVGFWRGVRTPRWTYARWLNDEHPRMLLDLENDPFQRDNLAGKPEFADIEAKLEARLTRWIEETADPFETGDRDERSGMLLLGQEYASNKWERQ